MSYSRIVTTMRSLRRRLAIRGEFLRIEGESMSPTLRPGEVVFVRRQAFRAQGPKRGDVVVARPSARGRRRMIKRVIGLPKDRLSLEGRSWQLGEDEFFLLGDHPARSTDSRSFGPVRRQELLGPAVRVMRPWRALPHA